MDVPHCGCQMKVLYESGWFPSDVKYHNDHLQISLRTYFLFKDGYILMLFMVVV